MKFTKESRRIALAIGVTALSLGLGGCLSGGGSSDSSTATPSTPTASTPTTLTGAAVAGPINGQACAYAVDAAGTAATTALGCATTNATTGAYSITFNDYVGAILVKAFGTYKDEATGQTRTIAEANALRAVVNCVTAGSTCQSAVTPLTEAAILSAGTLTTANLEAAYLKVAQAWGLNPTDAADAVTKLVGTLPDTLARTDAAATKYADILALASQAQVNYCGTGSACTLDSYLASVKAMLGDASGVNTLQASVNAALASWATNPNNTTGISCAMSGGTVTCNLPSGGSGTGTGSAASGNYRLDVTVSANGIPTPAIVINNVKKPSGQDDFCNNSEVTSQLNSSLAGVGSWTMNSCSFDGTNGTISATVTITTPISMSLPYTVSYKYTAL